MQPGKILVAEHQGAYMIKLVGDVRVTWCASFDDYLQAMFSDQQFSSIFVDLSDVEGIDSTTLGLLAKLAIEADRHYHHQPTIYSPQPSISLLLDSMGFDAVFTITQHQDQLWNNAEKLDQCSSSDEEARDKVIEAHKVLMSLNDDNRLKFEELVSTLEASVTDY